MVSSQYNNNNNEITSTATCKEERHCVDKVVAQVDNLVLDAYELRCFQSIQTPCDIHEIPDPLS